MKKINSYKVCNVSFLNASPYSYLSELKDIEYFEKIPFECSRMVYEDEANLGLIPISEFCNHGGLDYIPYGISSKGAVKSVLLFSEEKLENIRTVLLDSSSNTSVVLLKIILLNLLGKKFYKLKFARLHHTSIASKIGGQTAGLIIGDPAIKLASKFKHTLDLGQEWFSLTNLPFPFAIWAGKKYSLSDNNKSFLSKQIELSLKNKSVFARSFAEKNNISLNYAENYINNVIKHKLDKEDFLAIEKFNALASEIPLLPLTSDNLSFDSSVSINRDANNIEIPDPVETFYSKGNNKGLVNDTDIILLRFKPRNTSIDKILADASSGKRISVVDAIRMANEASIHDLSIASNIRKDTLHPGKEISYIVDRNINYTNICNVYCRFCAFYSAPGKEGGYLLTKEEIGKKIEEMLSKGGIQILLQGGLNPDLGIEYYEDLFSWIKSKYPVNLHALSADEILHISKISKISFDETFDRLISAGLGSFPGGGGEILVDRIRERIARLKTSASEWLEIHRTAHRKGLISTCTMMFGVNETWEDRILHLSKLRSLQDETGGFTAFISWPFQDLNTKLAKGDTSPVEYLKVQAVSRLFLDNIAGIQSSWVTMGPSVGQIALLYGANDFGSVMFEENVVSSAGTTFSMDADNIEKHILTIGQTPWKRDIHYNRVD